MKRHHIILLASGLVFCVAILLSSFLSISSNMEEMVGEDHPLIEASKEYERYFDSQEQVLLLVEKQEDADEDAFATEAVRFLETMESSLAAAPYVDAVYYRFDLRAVEAFSWAYLHLDVYEQIEQALDANDLDAIEDLLTGLEELERPTYEYLISDSGRYYMMIVKPRLDGEDYVGARTMFYDGLQSTITTTLANLDGTTLKVGLTGGGFLQDLESDRVAFEGLFSTVVITIAIVILILVLFLRTIKLPLLAIYPLVFGALIAGSMAFVIYGSINMFAVSFALLLVGLGIDFAVHVITRYQEERHRGLDTDQAVRQSIRHTGVSILFGAITTSFAFASFLLAEFAAFEQMGVVASVGILALCAIMLVVLPAMIRTFGSKGSIKRGFVSLPLVERGIDALMGRRLLVVLGVVGIALALSIPLSHVKLRTEMDAIYPDNIPAKQYVDVVETEFGYSTDSLATFVASFSELRDAEAALEQSSGVRSVETILDYMPTDQETKLAILRRLDQTLRTMGVEAFADFTLRPMTVFDLPQTVQDNFIGKEGTFRLDIVPDIDLYDRDSFEALRSDIVRITTNEPVGLPVLMNEITRMVQTDIWTISLFCLGVVLIVVLILFKTWKAILITMLPLLLTLYTTIALLPVLRVDMNVFSIAAFPLIIGIAIDSAIHLLHRFQEPSQERVAHKTALLAKAILLTTLTTMVGFGSLSMINHPGMANLGLTVAIGVGVSFLYTIVLCPLLYLSLYPTQPEKTTSSP